VNGTIQSLLLGAYRLVRKSGVLDTEGGRRCFEAAYDLYKGSLEARNVRQLRTFVKPGSTVIDVGANVGFFTIRFAEWAGEKGCVLAIEPEEANIRRLRHRISRRALDPIVQIIPAAATETPGTVMLAIDPDHPGNHHLAETGAPVEAVTVDSLLAERACPPVSLIKIDVQGAEQDVIAGAAKTLETFRPALFVEVDLRALAAMGHSPHTLFERLERHGYRIHRLGNDGPSPPVTPGEVLASLARGSGYGDFLFLNAAEDRS